jgi:arginine decarboxylase
MVEHVRRQAEKAAREGRLDNAQVRMLLGHYEESLRGYTYLTD